MPEILKTNEFNFSLDDLDPSQLEAVTAPGANILLRAPAGSGKTRSLMYAIANYRYNWLNDRICAITYTRAARAEMEQRLNDMGIHDVEVTTIHVWARNLLNEFAVKYNIKIKILQEGQIKSILADIIDEYLKHSKIRNIKTEIAYSFIMGNKNMDVSDNYKRTLVAIESRYIKYKRDNVLYDFTDYPLYLYDILLTYNEYINNIDALFVDEYQDVDTTQLEVFNRVNSKKKFYVGDPWQSIFVFRGADGEVFKKTTGFDTFKLKYNYRSDQQIIDYASTVYASLYPTAVEEENCFISSILYPYPSDITCKRGYGEGWVAVVNPFGRNVKMSGGQTQYGSIASEFKTFMADRPMILCRTNKQVNYIQKAGYFETSTVHQAKGLEYDNVIVIDTTISSVEDLNIAYVAMTRARNKLLVINWQQFEMLFENYWGNSWSIN